ncbi:hypothetical protein GCM10010340_46560 [Streptomyces griseoloalbus]|nr:hypothetical protein GCM10010340_46560 [Streptomyces albaduncus]
MRCVQAGIRRNGKKARVSDPGLLSVAGDENRTNALSEPRRPAVWERSDSSVPGAQGEPVIAPTSGRARTA